MTNKNVKIQNLILANDALREMFGIPEENPGIMDSAIVNLQLGLCPHCSNPVNNEDFRDKLSFKEYNISGLCQNCQDEIFRDPDED